MKTYEQRVSSIFKKAGVLKIRRYKELKAAGFVSLAALCSAAVLFAVLNKTDNSYHTDTAQSTAEASENSGQIAIGAAKTPVASLPRPQIYEALLDYSELKFNYEGYASYLEMADQTEQFCLAYMFSQELLADCDLVVKATIESVDQGIWDCAEQQPEGSDRKTLVYTLRIDKVFYTDIKISEGDTFVIEQVVLGGTLSDSEFGLKVGGQYLLPLANQGAGFSKSEYGLVYAFEPMIEICANGAYLFSARWPGLFNERTAKIKIDVPMAGGTYNTEKEMFVRAEEDFETDFQQLVDYYCLGVYAQDSEQPQTDIICSLVDDLVGNAVPTELFTDSIDYERNRVKDEVFIRVSFVNSADQLFIKVSGEETEMYYGSRVEYWDYYFSETLSFYMAKRDGCTKYSIYPADEDTEYIEEEQAVTTAAIELNKEGISAEEGSCIAALKSVYYETVSEYNDTMTPCWYLCFKVQINGEQEYRKVWTAVDAVTGGFKLYAVR